MNNEFDKIRNNIELIKKAKYIRESLLNGEIEEIAMLYKGKSLKYNDVSRIFKETFNLPLLSCEYVLFCRLLSSNGCFDVVEKSDLRGVRTVSLMDNLYSKNAFQQFNKHFALAAEYENSFVSLCEAVYSNRSFYAILPLFNTIDGLITSVYKLIQKYELKIVASSNVLVGNGETETEFVLVSHYKPNIISNNRLMVSVTHNYGDDIIDLLAALKSSNIFPYNINTLPLSYTDDRCESLITFDISACNCDAICCFLQTALPQSNVVGIYSIVK